MELFSPSLFTLHSSLPLGTGGNSPNAMGIPLPEAAASKLEVGEFFLIFDFIRDALNCL